MVTIILRTLAPLALLAVGIASLVYGIGHHTATVTQEEEIEIDLAPPPGLGLPGAEPFGPPGFGASGQDLGDPSLAGAPPWMAAPPGFPKVKEKVLVTTEEPELVLIREVTFGGVVLLDSGVLRRTYSGAPPSLCPT